MALTKNQVSEIRLRLANGEKGCDLANEFGVSDSYISQIKSHKRGMKQVWLTVEEAKYIRTMIEEAMAIRVEYLDYGDESPMDDEAKEMFGIFCKRIEDAEKGNE